MVSFMFTCYTSIGDDKQKRRLSEQKLEIVSLVCDGKKSKMPSGSVCEIFRREACCAESSSSLRKRFSYPMTKWHPQQKASDSPAVGGST